MPYTGIKVLLDGKNQCRIDWNTKVDGFGPSMQNTLINLVTNKGTDPAFPDRGTDMLRDTISAQGLLQYAPIHIANFAAAGTLYFERLTSPNRDDPDEISRLVLQPISVQNKRIRIACGMTAVGGTVTNLTTEIDAQPNQQ
jgi:hypothetical protein